MLQCIVFLERYTSRAANEPCLAHAMSCKLVLYVLSLLCVATTSNILAQLDWMAPAVICCWPAVQDPTRNGRCTVRIEFHAGGHRMLLLAGFHQPLNSLSPDVHRGTKYPSSPPSQPLGGKLRTARHASYCGVGRL